MRIIRCKIILLTSFVMFAFIAEWMSAPYSLATETTTADKVVIEKKSRKLSLYSKGQPIKTYKVALGRNPEGAKEKEGDNKTPEGTYTIDTRNTKSSYHLALHISYPNTQDIQRAKQQGVSPGGNIMIHGIRNGLGWIGNFHRSLDWTKGCIAVTNDEIDEIGRLVANGTPVEIKR